MQLLISSYTDIFAIAKNKMQLGDQRHVETHSFDAIAFIVLQLLFLALQLQLFIQMQLHFINCNCILENGIEF